MEETANFLFAIRVCNTERRRVGDKPVFLETMALVVSSDVLALALPVLILADEDTGSLVGSGVGDRSTDGDSGEREDESEKLHCDCGGR
jgi:hypothetical protein